MADTFEIREEVSDESLLALVLGRKRQRLPSARSNRLPLSRYAKTHEVMDLLVFCSVVLHWSTTIELTACGVYIIQSEYSIALLAELRLFTVTMILQLVSALFNVTVAGITTSLIMLDYNVVRRAITGFIFNLLLIFVLVGEIIVGSLAKKEVAMEDLAELLSASHSVPTFILRKAESEGLICATWNDQGCRKIYKKHINIYSNYLIGSAFVVMGVCVVTLPVYVAVYLIISKDLSGGSIPAISSRITLGSTPSLLSVAGEPSVTRAKSAMANNATSNPSTMKGPASTSTKRI